MKAKKTVYYTAPLHDDFAGTGIHTATVGADFPFARTAPLWRVITWLVYYIIAVPIVFLISKIYLGLKFENRKVLRRLRHTGYFLYGNHTRNLDAFVPAMAAFPKKAYIVAGPDAVSIPGLKNIVLMLGAIPIPTEFSGMRAFQSAVYRRYREGGCVAIYPEAHVWPFYTGIRPFPDTSFRYPAQENAPVVAMVTTYRRRKGLFFWARPGMTITFSEPFYPDPARTPRQNQRALREQVYTFLREVSETRENIAHIEYIQRPAQATGEDR